MTNPRAWLRNVATGYLDNAVGAVVFVIMTPLIVRHVGVDGYAVWVLSHLVGFYLELADLGLGEAQVRFHARYAARGRGADLRALTATITTALATAGTVGAVLGLVLASSQYVGWLDIPGGLEADLRAVLVVIAFQVLVGVPARTLDNVYEGAERFDLQNSRSIVVQLLAASAQLALLHLGYGVLALALVELVALCLTLLIDLLIVNRILPGLLSVPVGLHRRIWRRIRQFSIWASLDDLVDAATSNIDDLLLVALLPFAQLTPYALAGSAASLLAAATQPLVDTFLPLATGLHARRRKTDLATLLTLGTRAVVAIAVPIAIFLCLFGAPLLHVWVPESSGSASATLVTLLTLSGLVSVFLWPSSIVLAAVGRVKQLVVLLLIEVALDVALILILAPGYGLVGIATASLASNAAVGLLLELPLIARVTGVGVFRLIAATVPRIALASLPALGCALWIAARWHEPGWLGLAGAATAIGASYAAALLLFGVSGEERALLRRWVARQPRRRRHGRWRPRRPAD